MQKSHTFGGLKNVLKYKNLEEIFFFYSVIIYSSTSVQTLLQKDLILKIPTEGPGNQDHKDHKGIVEKQIHIICIHLHALCKLEPSGTRLLI